MSTTHEQLLATGGIHALRPWMGKDGKVKVMVSDPASPGGLGMVDYDGPIKPPYPTKEQWMALDRAVLKQFQYRTPAVQLLLKEGLRLGGINAMTKMTLEHEVVDPEKEVVSPVTGLPQPLFHQYGLPLPFTHCDFFSNAPDFYTDPVPAEAAGRRVGEAVERTLFHGCKALGKVSDGVPDEVFGLCNFKATARHILTGDPTADVKAMTQLVYDHGFYGPYAVFYGLGRSDDQDSDAYSNWCVAIEMTADNMHRVGWACDTSALPKHHLCVVQLTPDVVQMVDALPLTVVRWDDPENPDNKFKVVCCLVPRIRGDFYNNCGIVYGVPKEF